MGAISYFPSLVVDSDTREVVANLSFFSKCLLFVGNSQDGHDPSPVSILAQPRCVGGAVILRRPQDAEGSQLQTLYKIHAMTDPHAL